MAAQAAGGSCVIGVCHWNALIRALSGRSIGRTFSTTHRQLPCLGRRSPSRTIAVLRIQVWRVILSPTATRAGRRDWGAPSSPADLAVLAAPGENHDATIRPPCPRSLTLIGRTARHPEPACRLRSAEGFGAPARDGARREVPSWRVNGSEPPPAGQREQLHPVMRRSRPVPLADTVRIAHHRVGLAVITRLGRRFALSGTFCRQVCVSTQRVHVVTVERGQLIPHP
jgi:hypothetical protein